MNVLILGAAGFIGTNLSLMLADDKDVLITLIDKSKTFFAKEILNKQNLKIIESELDETIDFDSITRGQDVVYHLVSSNMPTTSNQQISQDILVHIF